MTEVSILLRAFDDLETQKKALTEQLQPQFHEIFVSLLTAHPCLESLVFTAYTPYFMDGEPCEFGVNDLGANLVDIELDMPGEFFEYERDFKEALVLLRDGTEPTSSWTPLGYASYVEYFRDSKADVLALGIEKLTEICAAQDAGTDYVKLLNSIPEDVIKDMFGDHIQVTITREEVTVDEYGHD